MIDPPPLRTLLRNIVENESTNDKSAMLAAIEQGTLEDIATVLSPNRKLALKVLLNMASTHMELSKQTDVLSPQIEGIKKLFDDLAKKVDPEMFKDPITNKNNHQLKATAHVLQNRENRNYTDITLKTRNSLFKGQQQRM